MRLSRIAIGLAPFILALGASSVSAHVMTWRAGDSRVKGVGHCAKGPCMKRTDFSASKPHHHHGEVIVMGWNHDPHKCPSVAYR